MNVAKYKLKKDVKILDRLFLTGDEIYIEHYDPVNGLPQKVFDESKTILGKISSSFYWELDKIMDRV